MRPRDHLSSHGLLPNMEAHPRKDGLVSYRYHPRLGKPIGLGTDKLAAIQKVLDLLGIADDRGTIKRLWAQYQDSPRWHDLADRTKLDYAEYSVHILRVFGALRACDIKAPHVAKYLRTERGKTPSRANREISLLGNLIALAIERGEAEHNPCRGGQVARNRERPRTRNPDAQEIHAIIKLAQTKGPQWRIITMAAEFVAIAGPRQIELLRMHWPQFGTDEIRVRRAKQRKGIEKIERISVSPAMADLRARLQAVAKEPTLGAVFPNRHGNPYTTKGFGGMWRKLMREALAKGIVKQRFKFHDLRAHYTTEYKLRYGDVPNLHASKKTTETIYERSGVASRKSL